MRGLDFLHKGQDQCGERQHADPAGTSAPPNASNGRVDPEATGLSHLADNESEGPLHQTEQRGIARPVRVVGHFVEHHSRVRRKFEHGTIGESDAQLRTRSRLDDVAGMNIAAHVQDDRHSVADNGRASGEFRYMADDLGGIRRSSSLGVLTMPCQRVDKIAGEMGAIGRRQRGAILALEVILQHQFVVALGKNEVDAGALEISVEQQLRIRNDNGVRRHVRGVLGNGLDVDVLMGMRPMSVNGNVGVELARVIQTSRPRKRVNIYIIFYSLNLHSIGTRIAKPSPPCANPVQLAPADPASNIGANKSRIEKTFRDTTTCTRMVLRQSIEFVSVI